jgi:hypothetical protein
MHPQSQIPTSDLEITSNRQDSRYQIMPQSMSQTRTAIGQPAKSGVAVFQLVIGYDCPHCQTKWTRQLDLDIHIIGCRAAIPPTPSDAWTNARSVDGIHPTSAQQDLRRRPRSPYTSTNHPASERLSCSLCRGKTFARSHDRKRHYKMHHSTVHPTFFLCSSCGQAFSRYGNPLYFYLSIASPDVNLKR